MTGQQLIDAIKKHHLEDFDILYADAIPDSGITLEFKISDTVCPYPDCYKPARIYKYKVLKMDNNDNTECYDKEFKY